MSGGIVGTEFGYRRHGGRMAGIYPRQVPCCASGGSPPGTTFGQNTTKISLVQASQTVIATTDSTTFDGSTDVFVIYSFQIIAGAS